LIVREIVRDVTVHLIVTFIIFVCGLAWAAGTWTARSGANFSLALQLHFLFEVRASCFGLVGAPPERPCDDKSGLDAPLRELYGDAADFLNRPADQECLVRRRGSVFLGATFA